MKRGQLTERPILFSGPMVRAIIDGRKTMTRRVVKFKPPFENHSAWPYVYNNGDRGFIFSTSNKFEPHMKCDKGKLCPYGLPGNRLWVRETWQICTPSEMLPGEVGYLWHGNRALRTVFRADCEIDHHPDHLEWGKQRWRPSIYLDRRDARIFLEVTGVRVERLQDITEGDAIAEGFMFAGHGNDWQRNDSFRVAWDHLNAKRGYGWEKNPWVWCIEFKKVTI